MRPCSLLTFAPGDPAIRAKFRRHLALRPGAPQWAEDGQVRGPASPGDRQPGGRYWRHACAWQAAMDRPEGAPATAAPTAIAKS